MAPFSSSYSVKYDKDHEKSEFSSSFSCSKRKITDEEYMDFDSSFGKRIKYNYKDEVKRSREKHAKTLTELEIAKRKIKKLEDELKDKDLKLKNVITSDVYLQLIERIKNLETCIQPMNNVEKLFKENKKNEEFNKTIKAELFTLRKVNYDLNLENEQKEQLLANFRSLFWKSM